MEQQKKNFKLVSNKKTRVILPNMFTLVGVCIGLSSIKFAFDEKFTLSIIAIIVAAIIDGLDGRIARLIQGTSKVGKELGLENKNFKKISIFMNAFACHVNRSPCSGKISEILYKPGKFINASLDKASEDNERNYYKITNKDGNDIVVIQIAGLIARRIVCEISENQEVQQGSRIGMIRFGSRVDIYFENYNPLVKINQKTIAGETLLANK